MQGTQMRSIFLAYDVMPCSSNFIPCKDILLQNQNLPFLDPSSRCYERSKQMTLSSVLATCATPKLFSTFTNLTKSSAEDATKVDNIVMSPSSSRGVIVNSVLHRDCNYAG